ncbi:MAG: hypothetical protein KGQ49_01065 [Verrucomicrobia bacterium]|nr:hypothetical protein [Verrucomicrobiota bacterium]MBU6445972.1 hypothetical protein [Verrucomicrobiota bacterium]MDE3047017.1 hypothetical protein [Verrucomicrobiota bacterium]
MQHAIDLCYRIQALPDAEKAARVNDLAWLRLQMNTPVDPNLQWTHVCSCRYVTGVYQPELLQNHKPGIVAYANTVQPPILMIAFPGMQKSQLGDWVTIGKCFSKAVDPTNPRLAHLHSGGGFADAANAAVDFQLFQIIQLVLNGKDNPEATQILFCGHSLGGAVACLTAIRYFTRRWPHMAHNDGRVTVITIGQPKVLKIGSNTMYDQIMGQQNYLRIVTADFQGKWDTVTGWLNQKVDVTLACHAGWERRLPTPGASLHAPNSYWTAMANDTLQIPMVPHEAVPDIQYPNLLEEVLSSCTISVPSPNQVRCYQFPRGDLLISHRNYMGLLSWQGGELTCQKLISEDPDKLQIARPPLITDQALYCTRCPPGIGSGHVCRITLQPSAAVPSFDLVTHGAAQSIDVDGEGNLICLFHQHQNIDPIVVSIDPTTLARTTLLSVPFRQIQTAGLFSHQQFFIAGYPKEWKKPHPVIELWDLATKQRMAHFDVPGHEVGVGHANLQVIDTQRVVIAYSGHRCSIWEPRTNQVTSLPDGTHDLTGLHNGDLAGFGGGIEKVQILPAGIGLRSRKHFLILDQTGLQPKVELKNRYLAFSEMGNGRICLLHASGRLDLFDPIRNAIIWQRVGQFGHLEPPGQPNKTAFFPAGPNRVILQHNHQFWHIAFPE